MCEQEVIRSDDLGLESHEPRRDRQLDDLLRAPVREAMRRFERLYYQDLLTRIGTKAKAARVAGLTDEGLRQALRRHQLP